MKKNDSTEEGPVQAVMDEQVRSCGLIRALSANLAELGQVQFDYFGELNRLAKEVAPQIARIPATFPQYTPHDWNLHVRRLFGLADRLIDAERFASMYPAELFVLAASLFAHDWGMAVSDDERDAIAAGAKAPAGAAFSLLENEPSELANFARSNGVEITPDGSCPALREEGYWREYIRSTHAWRSGLRARRFFEKTDGGVAQAVAAACEGHWLDLSDIDSESRFPAFLNVFDQRINLRAIVVYVRLIDLFDIGEDRTPYALWRFVGLRDKKSAIEWSKHRALRPVNVEPYQPGRRVVVDGTATDPDLWAALLDLRDYIDQQLRDCMDLIARHPDARHTLDLAPVVRWNVKPQGFMPVQLRFEFDRARMFEILSNEIYQGDSYVFLRELLQNSIDAIRVRRAKQAQRPQDGIAEGIIEFKVVHGQDGDATVTCRDNGIGMDDYILRNYFAVAGVSYYRSPDFAREGLNIDPISRFGVGILSCFMVADSIEVTTYRDPRFYPASRPLRLVVPAVDKQFRVYSGSPDSNVGTQVVVNIRGAKLKKAFAESRKEKRIDQLRLQVTDYLATIAGFVEFPIIVDENDQRTVIVHPDAKADEVRERYGCAAFRQVSRDFPWEDFVLPQDLNDARRVLTTKTLDTKTDLALEGFEGWVTFVIPKDPKADFPYESYGITLPSGSANESIKVRWTGFDSTRKHFSRSSEHFATLAVYQNGILVPLRNEHDERFEMSSRSVLPPPRQRVGLKLSSWGRPDISRCALIDAAEPWNIRLGRRMVEKLWEIEGENIRKLTARERFLELGRFAAIHQLPERELLPFISELLPIPFLDEDGSMGFFDKLDDCEEQIALAPAEVDDWLQKNAKVLFDPVRKRATRLNAWRGERCFLFRGQVESSAALTSAFSLAWLAFNTKFYCSGMRFLTSPRRAGEPLIQQVWKKRKGGEEMKVEELLIALAVTGLPINDEQLLAVKDSPAIPSSLEDAVTFKAPFEHCFAFGSRCQNLNHPTTQALLRCHLALHFSRQRHALSQEMIGQFSDVLDEALGFINGRYYFEWNELNEKLSAAWDVGRKLGVEHLAANPPPLSAVDFVQGTIRKVGRQFHLLEQDTERTLPVKPQPFGAVIKEQPVVPKRRSSRAP